MREGWKLKYLSEVCNELFAGGDVPKDRSSKYPTKEYNIPIYSNGATNDGLYGYTDIPRVTVNSITVSARGTIGFSVIRTESYLPVVRLIVLIPNEELIILPFLKYVIETMDFGNSGSSIPQLTVPMIKKYQSPIPPLQEQQQIVAILDKAFKAIDQAKANIEKNIENAKELFQSKLNAIFSQKGAGWEEKTLGDVCEKTDNIKWQEHPNKTFEYIDLSSVCRESLSVTETTTVGEKNAPSRARKLINFGDVIFATTRPTLKRATIIDEELSGQICSTGYVVLRPNKNISSEWIFFYLLTSNFMDRMESLQRGASYPAVSDNDVKGSVLSIPLNKEDEKRNVIVMKGLREGTNDLVSRYQQKLEFLDELKKSILQKAFAGELTNKEVLV